MMLSWKRISAIFMKDYKDFSRNIAVSIVIILVPVLAAFYGRAGVGSLELHYMLINMAFAMVASFVQSCLIAEEKDKNTLRGLMLSPASTAEILIGKSLLSFSLTLFVIAISAYFLDYRPVNIGVILIAIIISSIFYIGVGTLLGLYAKSVMDASVLVLPVMIIFSLVTFITSFVEVYPILKVLKYLPNIQLLEIAKRVEAGAGIIEVLSHLGIITIWVVAILILSTIVYRKRMMDE